MQVQKPKGNVLFTQTLIVTFQCTPFSQTRLSQDDELALMAGYAAAMDASMSESSATQDVTTAIATGSSSPPDTSEPNAVPSGIGRPPEDWESQTGEGLDNSSLSMCMSEASCKKRRGESHRPEATSNRGHAGTAGPQSYCSIRYITLKAQLNECPCGCFWLLFSQIKSIVFFVPFSLSSRTFQLVPLFYLLS